MSMAARDATGQDYAKALAAALGGQEPWLSTPSPGETARWLEAAGWRGVRAVEEANAVPVGFWDRRDALQPMRLVRLIHATR